MSNSIKTIVVLGNGIAGISAAKTIREHDRSSRVIMISAEDIHAYSKPMLTKTPLNSFDIKRNFLYEIEWYDRHNIELVLNTQVKQLDLESKTIVTSKGDFQYDKCIYALGASNFVPSIPGVDSDRVIDIRMYKDIEKSKELAVGSFSAIVIGGGVIGLEMAIELNKLGLDVTVLELAPYLMPRLLDEETAKTLEGFISPIQVMTGVKIQGITEGEKLFVELGDGKVLQTDFVVMSTGVIANVKIAKEVGILCDRAIVVNEFMETSAKDVYACGDCAQYNAMNYVLWSEGKAQGETAGANASGVAKSYEAIDTSMLLNTHRFALFAAGDPGRNPDKRYEIKVEKMKNDDLFKVNPQIKTYILKRWYQGEKLVGAVQIGNLTGIESLRKEIFTNEGEQNEN
jgi:NAD(P)H-nitrite reductase large subunit